MDRQWKAGFVMFAEKKTSAKMRLGLQKSYLTEMPGDFIALIVLWKTWK